MSNMMKAIKWYFLKRKILRGARRSDCDLDGDIIYYKDNMWYVHVLNKEVIKKTPSPFHSEKVERDYLKVKYADLKRREKHSQKNHSL